MIFNKTLTKEQYLKGLNNLPLIEIKKELCELTSLRDYYEVNYNIFKGSIYHEVVRSALGFLSYPEKVLDEKNANIKFKHILEKGFMYSMWALTEPYKYSSKDTLMNCSFSKEEALEVIKNVYDDLVIKDYEQKTKECAEGIRAICKYAIWYYFNFKAYKDDDLIKAYTGAPQTMFPSTHSDIETKMKTIVGNIMGTFDVIEH